ncbi:MAG: hypothetical protein O2809_08930, partial [Proteobacteria bacterium]|nr:hypothetical protein [Pseudomonadota bacterium]
DSKPDLEGDVMTVAQQWEKQGILKGEMQKAQETARNMLVDGLSIDMVGKYTSLDLDTVLKLKNEIDKKTQH